MNETAETTLFPTETAPGHHHDAPTVPAEAKPQTPIAAPASAAEEIPAVPTQSLDAHEALRQRLAEAPAPLLVKDLTKGLTPKGKNAGPPPDFPGLLSEEVRAGRAHLFPSGSKGAERYWSKDERKVIQDAVLAAAGESKKLSDLQKVAREATGADKAFVEATINEMIEQKILHPQSTSTKPQYAKEKPRSLDRTAIGDAILSAAETPRKIGDLIKSAREATGAEKPFAESILQEMIEARQLHPQSSSATPLYGKNPPPDLREPVTAALKEAAAKPEAEAKLIARAQKATGAEKSLVDSIFKEMIEGKQLHKHKVGAKELYGSDEPPHPLDVDAGKRAFEVLVKAGIKLIDTVNVPIDEVLQRLKFAIENRPPAPSPEEIASAATESNPHEVGLPVTSSRHPESAVPDPASVGTPTTGASE